MSQIGQTAENNAIHVGQIADEVSRLKALTDDELREQMKGTDPLSDPLLWRIAGERFMAAS
ncbi:MAG: hypothetical protein AAF662_10040 [Pseudomonadota bacterium]